MTISGALYWIERLALVVLGLTLGAALASGAVTARGLLYDYQTLATGFLAVAAAYISVAQMRRSEAEQDRRHRDQIRELKRASSRKVLDTRMFSRCLGPLYAAASDLATVLTGRNPSAGKIKAGIASVDEQLSMALRFKLEKDVIDSLPANAAGIYRAYMEMCEDTRAEFAPYIEQIERPASEVIVEEWVSRIVGVDIFAKGTKRMMETLLDAIREAERDGGHDPAS